MSRLEALYHEHGPDLLGYLARSFGRTASPEDLLQETFLQAARNPRKLAAAHSPRAWLFTIARRVGITALRRRRPTVALTEQVQAPTPGQDARLAAVREAIAQLPDEHRQTLELRIQAQLSYDQIAQVLGVPVGTVRSRLHHAVRKLRDALGQET